MKLSTSTPHPPATIELRLRLPLVWLGLCLLTAVFLPDPVWNTLLIGIGGMFLIAFFWARQLAKGLYGGRQVQFSWVAVGDVLEEQFWLINHSMVPALWVEVLDEANVPGYRPATVRSVSNDNEIRWRETAVCQQRGQYQLGPWQIRTSDPFGIFTITRPYPVSGEIVIHPPIHSNIPIPLPAGSSSGQVRAQRTIHQATLNAASIRAYQSGDPFRWIHWPTSAKRGDIFVKSFDLDAAGAIWLCLDLREEVQLGEGLSGTEEHAVVLAASLTAQAILRNRPIGLAAYGRSPQIVMPGQGAEHRWRILRALALVRADAEVSLGNALSDLKWLARPGTAVVLITPDFQSDWVPQLASLQQMGVQLNVTLLSRQSFDENGISNEQLARELAYLGATVQRVEQGELGIAPDTPQKNVDFIVTGTGKVVMTQGN